MNIEISMKEYFEELKLMKEQYGQEEDLYPWIYMLLMMSECEKAANSRGVYEIVSIRDVHMLRTVVDANTSVSELNKAIRNKVHDGMGNPEFAIINRKSTYILGCVEIKTFWENSKFKELTNSEYHIEEAKKLIPQLLSHIDNCCKVLYTNGLMFYLLTKENEKILVRTIGNLKSAYNEFIDCNYSFKVMQESLKSWDNLLKNLISINWYDAPQIKI